jgi:hypothetical protein
MQQLFDDDVLYKSCRNLDLQAVRPWGPAQAYGVTFAHDDEEIFTASRSDYASTVGVCCAFLIRRFSLAEMGLSRDGD